MTPQQFKAEQENLGKTNKEMAALCKVTVRSVQRWRDGTRKVPGPVIALIEMSKWRDGK